MKRKIITIVAASCLIMGTVSAASLWGSYKGNAIVKVNVDGKQNKYIGAPAITYNNKVMLPIETLKQLGVTYTYDSKKLTASITKPISNTDQDIKTIKLLAEVAQYYNRITNLGDMLTDLSEGFSIASRGIESGNGPESLDTSLEQLNDIINIYNDVLDQKSELENKLSGTGIMIGESSDSFNRYFNSIDFYKKSFAGLEKYNSQQNEINFYEYLDNASDGFDMAMQGKQLSSDNFYKFMDYINQY